MPAHVIVTIPHCSAEIPQPYGKEIAVPQRQVVWHTDLATGRIFSLPCAESTIKAEVSRYIVDLNRERDDFSDLGVIIRVDWDNMRVLRHELGAEAVEARLRKYYDPFYEKINGALKSAKGRVLFINGHSMNSLAPEKAADAGNQRPEITIGTRSFTTASRGVAEVLCREMQARGYETEHDIPFAGGHIVKRFGKPPAVEALQIEANKKLYMDEAKLEVFDEKVEKLRNDINSAVTAVSKGL